jgi:hypothetical protein
VRAPLRGYVCCFHWIRSKAREAGGGIKPGAPSPRIAVCYLFSAHEMGDSVRWLCASAHFAGSMNISISILGLAPQALCLRLLRRLVNL